MFIALRETPPAWNGTGREKSTEHLVSIQVNILGIGCRPAQRSGMRANASLVEAAYMRRLNRPGTSRANGNARKPKPHCGDVPTPQTLAGPRYRT